MSLGRDKSLLGRGVVDIVDKVHDKLSAALGLGTQGRCWGEKGQK